MGKWWSNYYTEEEWVWESTNSPIPGRNALENIPLSKQSSLHCTLSGTRISHLKGQLSHIWQLLHWSKFYVLVFFCPEVQTPFSSIMHAALQRFENWTCFATVSTWIHLYTISAYEAVFIPILIISLQLYIVPIC